MVEKNNERTPKLWEVQLGNHIRKQRREKGFSTRDLAALALTSPSHIGKIERGESSPTYNFLRGLANAMGITTHELIPIERSLDEELESIMKDRNYSNEDIKNFLQLPETSKQKLVNDFKHKG